MREVIERRPDRGRAAARPAAPARSRPGRAEVALLVVGPGGRGRGAGGGGAGGTHVLGDLGRPVRHLGARRELAAGRSGAAQPAGDRLAHPGGGLGGRARRPGAAGRRGRAASPARASRGLHYNNVNPILLGMVLERTAGRTVSACLSQQLWGPLGMEADGSWSLDSRRSGLELLQAGLNGRAIDFAKLGALYLHRGAWRGRMLVPRGWVAESTRVDSGTDPSPTFQYHWWTRPGTGPPNDCWAQGNHGQFIYLSPHHNLVLVRFGTDYHHYDHWPDLLATLARRLRT